uniref:DUF202 domain-containing protein n=1 Tax=Leptocylindrus danicus TaxID=163516 RepID=A0A7S2P5P1_9STRA|mmetsp:Transcript_23646/g.35495  ORF Transcript_23646/g.35495 Transcript_23646/m.35495 type:complete len:202 (+) Transcript_23646:156-761(+)
MSSATEKTPLNQHKDSTFYFLDRRRNSSVQDVVQAAVENDANRERSQLPPKKQSDEGGGLLGTFKRKSGSVKSNGNSKQTREREHLKLRKVPIKVEPKVYFANERTFLSWLHTSIILAATSISIVSFSQSNPWSQIYGILLLPCAIAFILYALRQYTRRAKMIKRREPGPYEDLWGPTVLALMLMMSITVSFFVKLYSLSM